MNTIERIFQGIYFGVERNKNYEERLQELNTEAERVLEHLTGLPKREREKGLNYVSGCEEDIHHGMQHIVSLAFNMPPRQRIEKLLSPDDEQSLYLNTFSGLSINYILEWLSYNQEMINDLLKHRKSDCFQNAGDNIASFGAEHFDSKLEASFLVDESSSHTHEQKEKLIAALDAMHQYESIFKAREEGNIGRIILHTLCFAFSLANFGAGKTVSQGFTAQEGRRKPGKHDNAGLRAIKAEYKKKHSKFSNTQLWLAIKRDLSDGKPPLEYEDYTVEFEIDPTTAERQTGGKLVQKKEGMKDKSIRFRAFQDLK